MYNEEDKYLIESMLKHYRLIQTMEKADKTRERMIEKLLKNPE